MEHQPSLEEKLALASAFILQSPPGEVNDVFNDVRPIVGDDAVLEEGLLPALTQYNIEQLTLVELPNAKNPAIICAAAQIHGPDGDSRFMDPNSSQSFVFNHLRLSATDVTTFTPPTDSIEQTRTELDQEAEVYVKEHYQGGIWSVFAIRNHQSDEEIRGSPKLNLDSVESDTALETKERADQDNETDEATLEESDRQTDDTLEEQPTSDIGPVKDSVKPVTFQLYIVGNKYNPGNYWTGRWRSVYDIDVATGSIRGQIQVNVHYYEQGNVQLTTRHKPSIDLPSTPATATQIMKAILQAESAYQTAVNSAYMELGDDTFKQLRRALPVTKQKIDWNNIKTKIVLDDK